RRRHTRWPRDWSSDVCSSDLVVLVRGRVGPAAGGLAAGDSACEGAPAVAGGVEPGGSARRAGAAPGGGALGGVAVVRLGAPATRVFERTGEGRGLSRSGERGVVRGW